MVRFTIFSLLFSRLEYTARSQLFAVLIGESGTGKTSTLRRLKDELPKAEYMVLYISDSKRTPRSFYNYLLLQLGCKLVLQRNTARDHLHKQIEIMRGMQNRKAVVIVDEAHFFQVLSRVAVILQELPLGKSRFYICYTRSAFLLRITVFLEWIGVFLTVKRCFPFGGFMFS